MRVQINTPQEPVWHGRLGTIESLVEDCALVKLDDDGRRMAGEVIAFKFNSTELTLLYLVAIAEGLRNAPLTSPFASGFEPSPIPVVTCPHHGTDHAANVYCPLCYEEEREAGADSITRR